MREFYKVLQRFNRSCRARVVSGHPLTGGRKVAVQRYGTRTVRLHGSIWSLIQKHTATELRFRTLLAGGFQEVRFERGDRIECLRIRRKEAWRGPLRQSQELAPLFDGECSKAALREWRVLPYSHRQVR